MKCPVCSNQDTRVTNSRLTGDGYSVRRRRECEKCSFRFSTYEQVEILDLIVVKRDGSREVYSKSKLEQGLRTSLKKRSVSYAKFQKLVAQIERDIQKQRKTEIESSKIGEIVMNRLKKLDKIAYIRFASVYKSFDDLDIFYKEVADLMPKKKIKIAKKTK